jgi:uncharacterized protein YutD
MLGYNISHNYNHIFINLGNLYQYNYEQIINKFDLILSDYSAFDHVNTTTLRANGFFQKGR